MFLSTFPDDTESLDWLCENNLTRTRVTFVTCLLKCPRQSLLLVPLLLLTWVSSPVSSNVTCWPKLIECFNYRICEITIHYGLCIILCALCFKYFAISFYALLLLSVSSYWSTILYHAVCSALKVELHIRLKQYSYLRKLKSIQLLYIYEDGIYSYSLSYYCYLSISYVSLEVCVYSSSRLFDRFHGLWFSLRFALSVMYEVAWFWAYL